MTKWVKQNLTIAVIVTLLTGYGVGAAWAAVIQSKVERLDTIPERLARVETKVDLAIELLQKQNQ